MPEWITLSRECAAIAIPSGVTSVLPAGTGVRVMQYLGSSYTVTSSRGMFRIDVKDADAMGLTPHAATEPSAAQQEAFSEKLVWDQLKTVFDPEIPVNIADLGLIYSCVATPLEQGGQKIDIKMSMTAPGCGMGNVLKADVENKLARLPDVKEVNVEIVFEPPWSPERMSEAVRLQLGFDL
ncbi:MAG TPA: putative Fe-S cluster assembly protein SufT [Candidatus Acidoferrales bacterium]|nr:putative Fe-S cluster assembly protein SufT [Candidatus Acidoferrales bacterium]